MMKTKLATALMAALTISSACAFAANPFVDVPSDSWAYKSVVELADAGIIQGVDGQYFQGNRNITRYEAAEMVAKAMAHMDKASVEQRALINKLADEYADELNNLGVRVSALESRVGNVKLTGDARIRYRYQSNYKAAGMGLSDAQGKHGDVSAAGKKNDNSWDYRVRLRANAQVNDRTKVTYGLSTDSQSFSSNEAASSQNNNPFTDMAKVDYNFGGKTWNLSVGRTDKYIMGNAYGLNYGDIFDRAELKYKNDNFAVTAGYGKFKMNGSDKNVAGAAPVTKVVDGVEKVVTDGMDGVKTGYGEIEGFFGNGSAIGVYYNDFTRAGGSYSKDSFRGDDLWGAYISYNFGSKWNLLANYENVSLSNGYKTIDRDDSANLWVAQLTYGKAIKSQPGSWSAWVEYLNVEDGAYLGGSTNSWRFDSAALNNIKSWGVGGSYVFAKNAQFNVYQSFASKWKDNNKNNATDPEEQTRAEFVFSF